ERIPLTIADFDRDAGTISIVVQDVGVSSHKICALDQGERFMDIVGPLGHKSEIADFGTVVCVGGGLGIAPVYPIQRALKEAGNTVISILGARNEDLLIWRDRMSACADETHVVTDDGSAGERGFVTTALERLIKDGVQIDRVIAIGPPIMMRVVSQLTEQYRIPTIVSLNTIMVDGTGMCGGCRVEVGGDTRFTCVDGPEFDAHKINWDLFMSRMATYRTQEQGASERVAHPTKKRQLKRRKQRVPMPEQDAGYRGSNFEEVALGYTEAMAKVEAERCLQCKKPDCVAGCPVNVDIPGFIKLIAEGDFAAAAKHLKQDNKLPAICGRVCPQETQCEQLCIVGRKHEPVAIGRLERFAADYELARGQVDVQLPAQLRKERVAVVGGGPAGITCAAELAASGYQVTMFEALHALGGVLMYGIPEFRLPKTIVQRECETLDKLGVDIRLSQPIGTAITVPYLMEEGFDAVFISTGAGLPVFLGIPGENYKNVYSANEFLTRINLMHAYDLGFDTPVLAGRHTAVIGGGNVAMDSARSALRLGAEQVSIVYRRTRAEMPARVEEIHHALEEGIQLCELHSPAAILGDDNDQVCGLVCDVMQLGEPDDSGRRRPVKTGEQVTLDVDQVVEAIGQGPNPMLTRNWPELHLNQRGNIGTDERLMTNIDGVFAGGDIVTGAATVIEAMGAGKQAAAHIMDWLQEQAVQAR
ncbi:MAG: NADPH-dependent glutamate synthase, partial [Planctomycetota bacterium]